MPQLVFWMNLLHMAIAIATDCALENQNIHEYSGMPIRQKLQLYSYSYVSKRMWSFIKDKRTDQCGVATLKLNDVT